LSRQPGNCGITRQFYTYRPFELYDEQEVDITDGAARALHPDEGHHLRLPAFPNIWQLGGELSTEFLHEAPFSGITKNGDHKRSSPAGHLEKNARSLLVAVGTTRLRSKNLFPSSQLVSLISEQA